jgi:mannose-6-phosphate isomerase-like protein (cupin superfamily)
MKLVKKSQAKFFNNGRSCVGYEYPIGDKDINGAVTEITGRYPSKNRIKNLKCKEMGYVISGSGYVVIEDKKVELNKGDLILIKPGEKYYWFGNKLKMFVPCTPAFYPEQNKKVK